MLRTTAAIRCCLMLVVSLAAACASAQSYPVRPVRVIAPFTAGSAIDTLARVIGQKLADSWGQQMVIDNRVGANGIIGTEAAAKSPADGYTLYFGNISTLAVNPHLYSKLSYDPVKDFEAVSLTASIPVVLVVHPSLPAKSVKELIALAKAHPGQLNYASGGIGSAQHLPMEMLRVAAGINLVHVPYKGLGPAYSDVLGGQVPMMFSGVSNVVPYRKSGRLRVLAIGSPKRSPALPDVPTVAESGVPGFSFDAWSGYLAPAGTPKEVIAKLHADITRTLGVREVQEKLSSLGLDLVGGTGEEFAALIKTDLARFGKLVKEAGIRAE
jgi:tripartite-type tricarboxylate transporter receptor subunit TctC